MIPAFAPDTSIAFLAVNSEGWEIHDREASELAAHLVRRAVLAEQGVGQPLVLHADNGSPQREAPCGQHGRHSVLSPPPAALV